MNNLKRALSALLAAAILVTFSACNNTPAVTTTDTPAATTAPSDYDGIDLTCGTKPPAANVNADEPIYSEAGRFTLTNPNADEVTKRVYDYIGNIYTKNVLSGQQESTWMGSTEYEMDYISENSGGKLPAIRGLDYMHDDFSGVNERAIDWWNRGGIVTICWHTGSDFSGEWTDAMEDNVSDWDKMLTEGTDEYNAMIAGMDKAAAALLELQEAGVPVLWRPFHEFDGAWFWWGKGGAENFMTMWKIMYDRYTNYWHLNNLIWVYGYSHKVSRDWYVGDEYVDIVGADCYDGGTQYKRYNRIYEYAGDRKPICYHENGEIPDPVKAVEEGAKWCFFMTWHTEHITEDKNNTKAHINDVYNSDYVITLDELPRFH